MLTRMSRRGLSSQGRRLAIASRLTQARNSSHDARFWLSHRLAALACCGQCLYERAPMIVLFFIASFVTVAVVLLWRIYKDATR
jgi:hypothetical protein